MKKLLPILLATSLLLSACSIDWNDEKAELQKQARSVSFEKQKECLSYEPKIKIAIEEKLKGRIFQRPDYTHTEYLSDIFFSPKLNTCLYSVVTEEKYQDGTNCVFYKIYDYLSRNQDEIRTYIEFKKDKNGEIINECDNIAGDKKYFEEIKELKGE